MTTKRKAQTGPVDKAVEIPDGGAGIGWESYALSTAEAGRIGDLLGSYFEPDDEPTLALLALLKSFTYTRNHSHRGYMLNAVEAAVFPLLGVAHEAVDNAVSARWRELTTKGGATK